MVGDAEGDAEGDADGLAVGDADGIAVGDADGLVLGDALGEADGLAVGDIEGLAVGAPVGDADGIAVGGAVGGTPQMSAHMRGSEHGTKAARDACSMSAPKRRASGHRPRIIIMVLRSNHPLAPNRTR